MKLVRKKEFAVATLNLKNKTFIVYVACFARSNPDIQTFHGAQLAFLFTNKALIVIPYKCANFIDALSSKFAAKLLEHIEIIELT